MGVVQKAYAWLPTMRKFHNSGAPIRCMVGPVGSGKTTAASWELCVYLPDYCAERYGIKHTKWVIIRNTYRMLRDTTQRTVTDWFPSGKMRKQEFTYTIFRDGLTIEILFRSCDSAKDMDQFKSLDLTGYWIDESIEVSEDVKKMIKGRIGRFPQQSPVRFGIETTNPPDVEHPLYSQFAWETPPDGPVTATPPLVGHVGFWQPPRENEANLKPGYYDGLCNDYRDSPDWIAMYVNGKPGIVVIGRPVYQKFMRVRHVSPVPLLWTGGTLYRGWDNTGLCPACIVGQVPTARCLQVLGEYWSDRDGIVDFTKDVVEQCNLRWPGAKFIDYGDPAGAAMFSKTGGGMTSNAELMMEAAGVDVLPAEQSFTARQQAVQQLLERYDGLLLDPSCTRLINGFIGGYHHSEIGHSGIYREEPEKNRYSHPHDGLQYMAESIFNSQPETPGQSGNQLEQEMFFGDQGQSWMR